MPAAMPVPSRSSLVALAVLGLAAAAAGCGSEIGDSCSISSDCNPSGDHDDRICDQFSPSGYCTVRGCDYNTCPQEAVCIRFFTGSFENRTCDALTEDISTDMCEISELCALDGHCVPRQAEVRYCMRLCESTDDCRAGYECRTRELMEEHGGQPVLGPGESLAGELPGFCAIAPST
jgi:hypothetical protein